MAWRFAKKNDAMWRKILVARHEIDGPAELDLGNKAETEGSVVVKTIFKLSMGRGSCGDH